AADFEIAADAAAEPAATSDAKFGKKSPIAQCDVGHHARRAEELRVGIFVGRRKIADDVLASPAAASHHCGAGTNPKKSAALRISDLQEIGALGIAFMRNTESGSVEAQTRAR